MAPGGSNNDFHPLTHQHHYQRLDTPTAAGGGSGRHDSTNDFDDGDGEGDDFGNVELGGRGGDSGNLDPLLCDLDPLLSSFSSSSDSDSSPGDGAPPPSPRAYPQRSVHLLYLSLLAMMSDWV